MKTMITLMFSCLLLAGAQAQIPLSATNFVTVAEAVKIVSGLRAGMKEDDADEYLLKHGINGRSYGTNGEVVTYRISTGDNFWWTTSYPLKAPFGLGLEYSNAYTTTNSEERNGLLHDAKIFSNNVDIISITLTNSQP